MAATAAAATTAAAEGGGAAGLNICLPMGGLGQRFRQEGYRFPKPLVNIAGRALLLWVIDNLRLTPQDTLFLVCPAALVDEWQIGRRLAKEYDLDIRVLALTKGIQTRGAAETLYVALQSMSPQERARKTISLDCDTIYFSDVLGAFRDLPPGWGASFYFIDHGPAPIFSYIELAGGGDGDGDDAEAGRITRIREKVKLSDYANTGAYAFASGTELKGFIDELLDNPTGEAGEYYTSSVIATMIQAGHRFKGIHVPDFVCVGTPRQLQEFLRELRGGRKAPGSSAHATAPKPSVAEESKITSAKPLSELRDNAQKQQQQQQQQQATAALSGSDTEYEGAGGQDPDRMLAPLDAQGAQVARPPGRQGHCMRFCFDLDNCLVTFPNVKGVYTSVEPIESNVQLVRDLKAAGHYIIIHTARRMKTHRGNIGAVIADIGQVTMDTLRDFDIPYDELVFGKPHADIYVDDLAVNSVLDLHKELGWANPMLGQTVPAAAATGAGAAGAGAATGVAAAAGAEGTGDGRATSEPSEIAPRHFNTIFVDSQHVIKSAPGKLLDGEIYFYTHMPEPVKHLFPEVVDVVEPTTSAGTPAATSTSTRSRHGGRDASGSSDEFKSIIMRKLEGVTFSVMIINRCLTLGRLRMLLNCLHQMHTCEEARAQVPLPATCVSAASQAVAGSSAAGETNVCSVWLPKIQQRFEKYRSIYLVLGARCQVDVQRVFDTLTRSLQQYEQEGKFREAPMIHGDPVFSNVILCNDNTLKMIDMRGSLDSELTLRGDILYDLSKVYQSLHGYDFFLLDQELTEADTRILAELRTAFFSTVADLWPGIDASVIPMLTAAHLFSIVPLHQNQSHQQIFLSASRELLFGGAAAVAPAAASGR